MNRNIDDSEETISEGDDLTPEERARLEVLKLEWESWRRGAEAQGAAQLEAQ
jgi:hypothetical protein